MGIKNLKEFMLNNLNMTQKYMIINNMNVFVDLFSILHRSIYSMESVELGIIHCIKSINQYADSNLNNNILLFIDKGFIRIKLEERNKRKQIESNSIKDVVEINNKNKNTSLYKYIKNEITFNELCEIYKNKINNKYLILNENNDNNIDKEVIDKEVIDKEVINIEKINSFKDIIFENENSVNNVKISKYKYNIKFKTLIPNFNIFIYDLFVNIYTQNKIITCNNIDAEFIMSIYLQNDTVFITSDYDIIPLILYNINKNYDNIYIKLSSQHIYTNIIYTNYNKILAFLIVAIKGNDYINGIRNIDIDNNIIDILSYIEPKYIINTNNISCDILNLYFNLFLIILNKKKKIYINKIYDENNINHLLKSVILYISRNTSFYKINNFPDITFNEVANYLFDFFSENLLNFDIIYSQTIIKNTLVCSNLYDIYYTSNYILYDINCI